MKSKKRKPPRPVPVLTPKQEAFLSAISESKQFTLAAVLARHASVRPVPALTPGQIAFHGGHTSHPDAFSLAKVTAIADKLSGPVNAHLFTKEAVHRAFAHLKPVDLDVQSRHVTSTDGNVFEDLGFETEEAKRLLAEADRKIGTDDDKEK